jgi:hypothetical protein
MYREIVDADHIMVSLFNSITTKFSTAAIANFTRKKRPVGERREPLQRK